MFVGTVGFVRTVCLFVRTVRAENDFVTLCRFVHSWLVYCVVLKQIFPLVAFVCCIFSSVVVTGLRFEGKGQGLVNWSSRILEDKDLPRGQQHCFLVRIRA